MGDGYLITLLYVTIVTILEDKQGPLSVSRTNSVFPFHASLPRAPHWRAVL